MRHLLTVVCCIAVQVFAQAAGIQKPMPFSDFIEEVKQAGAMSNVDVNEGLIQGLEKRARSQSEAYGVIYANVPQDKRISRLADYLAVKSKTKRPTAGLKVALYEKDLGDFHWAYLSRDFAYYPVRVESSASAKLDSVEVSGIKMEYGISDSIIESGMVVVLPELPQTGKKYVTVTLDVKNSKLLWTGNVDGGALFVAAASTSRGGEIDIKSEPPGALVTFNGRPWRHKTNTKSVRDPGRYEVRLELDGYKEWREEKFLQPGGSWSIDAKLEKR